MKIKTATFGLILGLVCLASLPIWPNLNGLDEPKLSPVLRYYMCHRTAGPITIDGRLDENSWKSVYWSEDFMDIEGKSKPKPRFRTRVKMLWDDEYFYVGAELEEPQVWA
ncbi:MAG: carbohydrate-binding family 9-like protein, partial [Candidatus Aminicenantes bacterium]|nr:carbohydrate-binding family 9-like protein [Candidatus Aminicenantes bacterium]